MSIISYSYANDLSSNFDGSDFQDDVEDKVELQGNVYEGAGSDGQGNFTFTFTNALSAAEQTALDEVVAAHTPKSLADKRFCTLPDQNLTLSNRDLRSTILLFSHTTIRTYTLPDALALCSFHVINDGSANCIIAKEDAQTKGNMTVIPGETGAFRCVNDMLVRFS